MEEDVQGLPLAAIKGLYRRAHQATTRRYGQIRMDYLTASLLFSTQQC